MLGLLRCCRPSSGQVPGHTLPRWWADRGIGQAEPASIRSRHENMARCTSPYHGVQATNDGLSPGEQRLQSHGALLSAAPVLDSTSEITSPASDGEPSHRRSSTGRRFLTDTQRDQLTSSCWRLLALPPVLPQRPPTGHEARHGSRFTPRGLGRLTGVQPT